MVKLDADDVVVIVGGFKKLTVPFAEKGRVVFNYAETVEEGHWRKTLYHRVVLNVANRGAWSARLFDDVSNVWRGERDLGLCGSGFDMGTIRRRPCLSWRS